MKRNDKGQFCRKQENDLFINNLRLFLNYGLYFLAFCLMMILTLIFSNYIITILKQSYVKTIQFLITSYADEVSKQNNFTKITLD